MEGNKIASHKDLIVWQKAMDLVVLVYRVTEKLPKNEMYGLASQMKRAAISIPSNIAEGRRRGTRNDYRHFLIIAFGSGAELETQIEIVKRIFYKEDTELVTINQLLNEILRMLNTMISNLHSGSRPTSYQLRPNS